MLFRVVVCITEDDDGARVVEWEVVIYGTKDVHLTDRVVVAEGAE